MGRWKFVHIPPGGKKWVQETFSREGLSISRKTRNYLCVSLQCFGRYLTRLVLLGFCRHNTWIEMSLALNYFPSQIAAANPILVLAMIPLFYYLIYPFMKRHFFEMTPLRDELQLDSLFVSPHLRYPLGLKCKLLQGETPHVSLAISFVCHHDSSRNFDFNYMS